MKFKKRLVNQLDGDFVSPERLVEGLEESDSAFRMPVQEKGKGGALTEEDYVIQINQPHEEEIRYSGLDVPINQEILRRTSSMDKKSRGHGYMNSNSMSSEADQKQIERMARQMTKINSISKTQGKKPQCSFLFEKNNQLQKIIRKQKINNVKKNFIKKVRRMSLLHPPAEYELQRDSDEGLLNCSGIELPPLIFGIINLVSVIQIISLVVIYSISLVFEDLLSGQYSVIQAIQMCSFVFYFAEIVLNLITVKYSAGKSIHKLRDIVQHYVGQHFWIDSLSFIILLIDISSKSSIIGVFRMFILFKLPQCIDKIQKLEVFFIRNVYNEQYWELLKVFLVNFCVAHVIGIFLGAMANLSPNDSWLVQKGFSKAPWGQKYVWSFYWAVNIMLTVGFGDISAANHKEAICLIFIETFSCIIMAYNINRVGSIISKIRLQDQNRSKKFKIFRKLTDQNQVSEELAFKINNYIEESSNIKKKFNYEEDQEFLKELPTNLRTNYLREANKQIFGQLVFFKSLLDKTLYNFSQQLQTKISHPQEIIRALDDDFNLTILRKGHIGYLCKKNGCGFNDTIVDQIKVKGKDLPFLTSLNFISKIRPLYEIKSLQFSVLFTLSAQAFIEIFRKSDMDYELFCFLRDKSRNMPDEFQVKQCQFCKDYNHFKFTCPRLHYVPYEQHVVTKYLHRQKVDRNGRKKFERQKDLYFTPMQYYKEIKGYKDKISRGKTKKISQKDVESVLKQTIAEHYSAIKMKASREKNNKKPKTYTFIQKSRDDRFREIVEEEFLKRDRITKFDDNVWILALDALHNFNGYFSRDNPKFITSKFSKESRMNQQKMRFKVGLKDTSTDEIVENNEEVDSKQLQSWVDSFRDDKVLPDLKEESD